MSATMHAINAIRSQAVSELRTEFFRLLTTDSETRDRRHKEYNQAIFDAEWGTAIFTGTSLDMVMEKFDRAVKGLGS